MKLLAVTFGTRGDFEPFLTLGQGLADAGHEVRLVSHASFAGLAEGSDVEFVGAPGRGMKEILETDEARAMMRKVGNPLTLRRRLDELLGDDVRALYASVAEETGAADAVLAFPATFPAMDAAENAGKPVVQVHHVPALPTKTFPNAVNFAHGASYGAIGNRLTFTADATATSVAMRRTINRARREVLGMPRASVRGALRQRQSFAGALIGTSPHVLSAPSDWPRNATVCGYWWPRAVDAPPPEPELIEFIETSPAPTVFLTLGSTVIDDPAAMTELLVGAAGDAGVRLILQSGWSGLGEGAAGEDVLVTGDLAYPEIFDRVDALAHHGGAGTVALGLRHAKPTLILPAIADQFFWGHRLHELGTSPEPLPLKKLTREKVAARLRELVGNSGYATAARTAAEAIAEEDGAKAAADAVGRFF
ncbi:MAG: glycosyltransferase [Solirubrobacterales bacterium]